MGKRIITQRRGRGTHTYKSPSHRFAGKLSHRKYDQKDKVQGQIIDLIHCPGHGAPLAVVKYEDNETTLIAAPEKVRVSDIIISGKEAPAQTGNTLPIGKIPAGKEIYNIEIHPGDGGKLVRNAGAAAILVGHLGDVTIIKLPSKKEKRFDSKCRATIGVIAGGGKKEKPFMKAGKRMHAMRARNKLYPQTSGVAMNAVDHPFGSGRGRHAGKTKTPPRNAPPGRNVGQIRAKRTGKKK